MYELERYLAEISGLDRVSLQPAAGAQGELTGMMMIRAYHTAQGNPRRNRPGARFCPRTNPSSSALSGYQVQALPSSDRD